MEQPREAITRRSGRCTVSSSWRSSAGCWRRGMPMPSELNRLIAPIIARRLLRCRPQVWRAALYSLHDKLGLPFIAIGIAGHVFSDAIPGIARRVPGALPIQARLAFEAIPIAAQIALDFLVVFAHIAAAAFPAVAIGGGILVIGDTLLVVGAIALLLPPMGILG